MPYIKPERRAELCDMNNIVYGTEVPSTAGELNFLITSIILEYMDGVESYTLFNEVLGVLEAVKLEFYRRKVVPYEQKKMSENGDVYDV